MCFVIQVFKSQELVRVSIAFCQRAAPQLPIEVFDVDPHGLLRADGQYHAIQGVAEVEMHIRVFRERRFPMRTW